MHKPDFLLFPDTSEHVEDILTFGREELRRYSVWEQDEMEAQQLLLGGDKDPSPAAVLLLCVSETAAAALQRDLRKLYVRQDGSTNTGEIAGTFIVLIHLQYLHVSVVILIKILF